jgi:Lon protease (S16) C-terminal proteolytic domain
MEYIGGYMAYDSSKLFTCLALVTLVGVTSILAYEPARAQMESFPFDPMLEISRAPSRPNDSLSHSIVFLVVARDQFGYPIDGQAMQANVEISYPGEGRVLIDSSLPLGIDWQVAAKKAAYVAQTITETDFSTLDIIFSVEPIGLYGPHAVDGPSAGAALTLLLLSEALQIPINNQVAITGTMETNGMIGQVGGVPHKVQAAGEIGARYMLVPAGSQEYDFQELSYFAQTEYGMQLIPVADIEDVVIYFLGEEGYCSCIFENLGLTS